MLRTSRVVSVMIAGFILIVVAPARADHVAELRGRIDALERDLVELRRSTDEGWLSEKRSAEVRALVSDVLADADSRTALLQTGATSGWDNGFFVASPDGNFRLQLWGSLQVRFVYNQQDESPSDDHRWGFENRRTRLGFRGHIGDPSWSYAIQGSFNFITGRLRLLDARIDKDFGNGWTVRAGKFMLPFTRQAMMSHARLLAVERSMVNNFFSVGRAEAVQVSYEQESWRVAAAFSDGLGGLGGTSAPALAEDTEYALTGRADVLLSGSWKQFRDFTSFRGDDPGVLLGAAVHWQDDEYGTASNDDETQVLRWTVDCSLEFGGANAFVAAFGNHTDSKSGTGDVDQYGLLVQGGFFVTDDLELFGRYQWGEEARAADFDDLSMITAGVNRYFHGHRVKWSADLSYALNAVSLTWARPGLGVRADAPGADGQIVLRSQLQLVF